LCEVGQIDWWKMKRKNTDKEGKNKRRKVSTKKFQGINSAKGKKTKLSTIFSGILFTCPTAREKEARLEAISIVEPVTDELNLKKVFGRI
jgi:hypothetical protein